MLVRVYAVAGLIFVLTGIALQSTMGNPAKGTSGLKSTMVFSTMSFLLYIMGFGLSGEAIAHHTQWELFWFSPYTLAAGFVLWWVVSCFCSLSLRKKSGEKKDSPENINVLPPRLPRDY